MCRRLLEPGRKRIADHRGTVFEDARAIAESIGIVGDSERRAIAERVNAGGTPATKDGTRNALIQPTLARPEGQFDDGRDGEAQRNVSCADRSFRFAVIEVLTEGIEGPETSPIGGGVVHQLAPGKVRKQREAMREAMIDLGLQ